MDYMKIHYLYTLQNSPFLIFITGNCLFFLPVCGVTSLPGDTNQSIYDCTIIPKANCQTP